MLALAVAAAAASPPLPASPRGALSPPGSPANRRRPPPSPPGAPAAVGGVGVGGGGGGGSLYEVLRVERTASPTEIKGAYRTLAKLYHPDALSPVEAGSDGRDFLEIHDAYATLSDPSARALYDLSPRVSPAGVALERRRLVLPDPEGGTPISAE
ncbi:hypothetical protein EUGRSUZ_F03659 [Eucalyptus grandis]|uniref:Uncharacterized protein n=2 Tax=Eucalyptus grandis TaxID=71139 RepID=A0ACC3KPG2_EUCGR|nr:hypothetical protein EUGRSUZ_F03659 [Eucalyptus grandis]